MAVPRSALIYTEVEVWVRGRDSRGHRAVYYSWKKEEEEMAIVDEWAHHQEVAWVVEHN